MATRDVLRAHALDQRRRGLQESTIGLRSRILQRFAARMGERGLLGATEEDIQQFLDSRGVQPQTRAGYISTLKVFYGWAYTVGHIEHDPTVGIVRPRVQPGLPRPIADDDLELALETASGKYRVIISLGAFQGMRCIEIARLTREDIFEHRDPPVLVARGKGDKPRAIPLHERVWDALTMLPMPRTGPVLLGEDGSPYKAWQISHLGNDYLHGLGLDATMHQLRHWFVTGVYQSSGHNLLLARDLAGHNSVETTRIYAAYDRAGAAEAVRALGVNKPRRPRGG